MELLEFVVAQFLWILLVPLTIPTSLHPQQIMKQYSNNLLYSPTNA